jgi:hypothetical protein
MLTVWVMECMTKLVVFVDQHCVEFYHKLMRTTRRRMMMNIVGCEDSIDLTMWPLVLSVTKHESIGRGHPLPDTMAM